MPLDEDILQRLKQNDPTLVSFRLESENIKEYCQILAKVLEKNTTLLSFLCDNGIGNQGCLAKALKKNTTLSSLDLRCNRIETESAKSLSITLEKKHQRFVCEP